MIMEMKEYQKGAMSTCMESCNNVAYMLTGLTAEVGEVNDKIAKAIRKGKIRIEKNQLTFRNCDSDAMCDEIAKELGDCLWFVSSLASVLGYTLEEIAQMNLDKLAARKAVGTIDGNGDGIIRGE